MTTGRPRDERKEREWRRRIRDWQSSGLSVRAFCESVGVLEPSFYAWRRKLAGRAAESSAFIPVRIVSDQPACQDGCLEVVLTGGRSVRVAPGFDAVTLRQLLAVLEGPPC